MFSPIRLSDHCRTRAASVLAGRGRPFSGSDKYLEEYKHRAEPLLGERLSFVFVTLCDRDLQQHSLRCARMFVTAPVQANELGAESSHRRTLTLSNLLRMWPTEVLNHNIVGLADKAVKLTANCSQLTPSRKERA